METRANYVAVGLFTLIVLLASFAFIYWVARIEESANLKPIQIMIRGQVSGLATGSDVQFNGIKVGKVGRVIFDSNDPRIVYAIAEISDQTPVRADTTATIAAQGLTQIAYVSLKGGTPDAPSLFDTAEPGRLPILEAQPSPFSDILETVRDVATKTNEALGTLQEFIEENREPISRTVANIQEFSDALGRNAEGVDEFLNNAAEIGKTLGEFSAKLDGTIQGIERLVAAVDEEKIRNIVADAEVFTQDLREGGEQIGELMASVDRVAKDLEGFSTRIDASLTKVEEIVGKVDTQEVTETLSSLTDTARDARQVMADAREVSQSLASRKESIEAFLDDASETGTRLREASKRLEDVLAKADGFLGGGEDGNVMADVAKTLEEFRRLAANLQSNVNEIAGGVAQFSNTGLRDVEALISEARRSMTRIDRVVGELERDPQRFLFGNSDVRTYNGRPRR